MVRNSLFNRRVLPPPTTATFALEKEASAGGAGGGTPNTFVGFLALQAEPLRLRTVAMMSASAE